MDYDKLIAPAAQAMRPSGIRKFFDLAAEMPECISLGVGEPDFKTPWAVREAGIESLEHGRTRYTSNAGLKELRAEISRYLERRMGLRYDPMRQILVTVGGSEAIDMCIRTLIRPGDEVIIPEPCFVCYEPITTLSGGVPVHVACRQEDEFRLRADALKAAITPRTKLVIMPFPNNPTGAVMEREDLEAVAEVLRDTNVMVLSDEIYAELNYGLRPHVSIASLPGMAERTIVVNGFSKSYAMTGWRLGYACGPEPIIKIMTKIHQSAIMSAPTTSQYAAITALRDCDGEIDRMRDEYNMRRRLVVRSFNDMGLTCFEPRGAFYAFPCIKSTGLTSQEFCTRLLEEKHYKVAFFAKCLNILQKYYFHNCRSFLLFATCILKICIYNFDKHLESLFFIYITKLCSRHCLMSATAELFHNNLHIYSAKAACGNTNFTATFINYKRGFYIFKRE